MKELFKKTASLCLILSLMLCINVYGTDGDTVMFRFTGSTTATDGTVSLLVLKEGTDINNISGADVIHIDQGEISGGRFSISFPSTVGLETEVYSNMLGQIKEMSEVPIYVSSSGDDTNDGETPETAVKTFAAAVGIGGSKIVLVDDMTITNLHTYKKLPPIEGLTQDVTLTLPSNTVINCDLKLDKLYLKTITEFLCNGYNLEIGENITNEKLLTIYGGRSDETLVGDTNITLLGGGYVNIYGGGKNTDVQGNTNIIIGGNVNPGKDINDDDTDTLAATKVYGGGYNGAVTGKTNVTLKDNAVVKYLTGAGYGTAGQVPETNIRIEGGKAMNVYGGAMNDGPTLTNCNTNVTMTGGVVEGIFGGSFSLAMTGNATIELIGGTVYRRVYTGCYNDYGWSGWGSSYGIKGTTTLIIHPGIALNKYSNLSSDNQADVGVFSGSRYGSAISGETNTLIYVDDCYSQQKSNIGDQGVYWISVGTNRAKYTVSAGTGGKVYGTYTAGQVFIAPTGDYVGKVGSTYYKDRNATVTASDNTSPVAVTFEPIVGSSSAAKTDTGVKVEATMNTSIWSGQNKRTLVAVYEVVNEKEVLVGVSVDDTLEDRVFDIDCTLKAGSTYSVSIMIWDENNTPMIQKYCINVQ